MININMQDLTWLISHAVDAGVQEYMKGVDPSLDKVKKSQAERFLESRGYKKVMLSKWTEAGLLHPVKSGETQNCALYFSLAEIKKTICIVKAKEICNN